MEILIQDFKKSEELEKGVIQKIWGRGITNNNTRFYFYSKYYIIKLYSR